MPVLDIAALGEFGLIEVLRRRARGSSARWAAGIGDDAAVLRTRANRDVVLTADALIEDVHFRWRTTDARSLGVKTLVVNLSDLGAMGATPLGCLLSLGLPRRASPDRLDGFVRGLLGTAAAAGCPLVGGDTVEAPIWSISLTCVGEVPKGRALRRAGARPGDRIMVAGEVGGSALGLALLERGRARSRAARPFVRRHLAPEPVWRAGSVLARGADTHAAIDVSDGLLRDLQHVLDESGAGADLHVERLPLPRGLRPLAVRHGLDVERLALAGGEDYALLFCVRPKAPAAAVFQKRLGCRVSEIGAVRRGRGISLYRDGRPVATPDRGFEHFKAP